MNHRLTAILVKMLASIIAVLIIYISVTGFMSLIGGNAGIVIGAIFGMSELAFIIFFPSTLIKWPLMSSLGKVSVTLIILSLSILSFASTNTYITKHMAEVTMKADINDNDIVINKSKIEENRKNDIRLQHEKSSLYEALQLLKNNLLDEEKNLEANMATVREIIFYKGKNCSSSKDCTDRKNAAKMIAGNTQKRIDALNEDISMQKQKIMRVENDISEIHKAIDHLYAKISSINQHKVEDNNAKKLYAGYEMVGSKINKIIGIENINPIQTFTTAIAIILYAMYILLTIWMNTLLHISDKEVQKHRHTRRSKNIFMRTLKIHKAYRNRIIDKKFEKIQQNSNALKNQLIEKINELKSANELLAISKQRELVLMKIAKPVTETVYVAVPENMTPSEVKRKVSYKGTSND